MHTSNASIVGVGASVTVRAHGRVHARAHATVHARVHARAMPPIQVTPMSLVRVCLCL